MCPGHFLSYISTYTLNPLYDESGVRNISVVKYFIIVAYFFMKSLELKRGCV